MAGPVAQIALRFAEKRVGKEISAIALIGDTLFCTSDEGAQIERLQRDGDGFGRHRRIALDGLFGEPARNLGEVDIEGLAIADGFLWLAGSHAHARPKPPDELIDADLIEPPRPVGGRSFLGCAPLVATGDGRFDIVPRDGARTAACLPITDGETTLRQTIGKHPLLRLFVDLPAKENGLDVEGLAVAGDQVLLGLRGPVIGRRAIVVEARMARTADGWLELRRHHRDHRLRFHAFDLEGYGIRDLARDGDRLLILAGPALAHDGPRTVYAVHWPADGAASIDPKPRRVAELPVRGGDNAEGIEVVEHDGAPHLLVVHDTDARRYKDRTLTADLFRLDDD